MKIYLLFTFYFFIIFSRNQTIAQLVPNGDFESWVNIIGLFENPEYWKTNNSSGGIAVSKSTDFHNGNYAMQISSTAVGIDGPTDGVARLMYYPGAIGGYTMHIKVDSISETGKASIVILGFRNGSPEAYGSWESNIETTEFKQIIIPLVPDGIYDSVQIYCNAFTTINSTGQQLGHARFLLDEITELPPLGLPSPMNQNFISFSVHPNPVMDDMIVTKTHSESLHFEIFNLKGEMVHEGIAENALTYLNIQNWPNGIYILRGACNKSSTPSMNLPFIILH